MKRDGTPPDLHGGRTGLTGWGRRNGQTIHMLAGARRQRLEEFTRLLVHTPILGHPDDEIGPDLWQVSKHLKDVTFPIRIAPMLE